MRDYVNRQQDLATDLCTHAPKHLRPARQWTNARALLCCLPLVLALFGFTTLLESMSVYAQDEGSTQQPQLQLYPADSSNYPEVKIEFSLLGVDPELIQSSINYQITGTDLVATADNTVPLIAESTNGQQPLNLLLVLDCSVIDPSDWEGVRTAANTILDNLAEEDEVALIIYALTPDIHAWIPSSRRDEFRGIIDDIAPQRTWSRFNLALQRALEIVNDKQKVTGNKRSAIIMIGDRSDNVDQSEYASETLQDRLRTYPIPLYIYGYGEKASASRDIFEAYTKASTGHTTLVDAASQLNEKMPTLMTALHRRYRTSNRFGTPIIQDGGAYTISVNPSDNQWIPAAGTYRTLARPLQLFLHGLELEKQYGQISVTTDVLFSPATAFSMTYYITSTDHLTAANFLPSVGPVKYSPGNILRWDLDKDIANGHLLYDRSYWIQSVVEDELGNRGVANASFHIAKPLTGTLYLSFTKYISGVQEFDVGKPIPLAISAQGGFPIQEIDIKLDDDLYTTVTDYASEGTPMALTPISQTQLTSYTVQAYITDTAGRSLAVPLQAVFVLKQDLPHCFEQDYFGIPCPSVYQRWLAIVVTLGSIVLLLLIWFLVTLLLRRRRQARLAYFWLKLMSQGNVTSHYQLRAVEANGANLDFQFDWQGKAPEVPPEEETQSTDAATSVPIAVNDSTNKRAEQKQKAAAKATTPDKQYDLKSADVRKGWGFLKGFGDLLREVGRLPGPLGRPANRLAGYLQRNMGVVEQGGRTAQYNASTVGKLAGRIAPSATKVNQPNQASSIEPVADNALQSDETSHSEMQVSPEQRPVEMIRREPNSHLWDIFQSASKSEITHVDIRSGQSGWSADTIVLPPGTTQDILVQVQLHRNTWYSRRYIFTLHARNLNEKALTAESTGIVRLGGLRKPLWIQEHSHAD